MKRAFLYLITVVLLQFNVLADSVSVCSFNIQWLGGSTNRDNASLAEVVKEFDIVVVQELVAPPFPGEFPDKTKYKPDPQAAAFFDEMKKRGFEYAMSPEDTGTNDRIHINSSATEWWVTFFKTNVVNLAADLPTGFLAADRSDHPDYERVPFAFGFRTIKKKMDFVLISVHLQPDGDSASKARRKHELNSIYNWIQKNSTKEKDFIILGDMNIEDFAELSNATPPGFVSLNAECVPTNTNPKGRKPYDHVMYSPSFTSEVDKAYGFKVINLITAMRDPWKKQFPSVKYPGDAPYDHTKFRQYYSDHNPVAFRLNSLTTGDDD